MIKEILEQLAPLDAQIAALKGSGNEPMKESTGTMASNMFITAYQQTVNLI